MEDVGVVILSANNHSAKGAHHLRKGACIPEILLPRQGIERCCPAATENRSLCFVSPVGSEKGSVLQVTLGDFVEVDSGEEELEDGVAQKHFFVVRVTELFQDAEVRHRTFMYRPECLDHPNTPTHPLLE